MKRNTKICIILYLCFFIVHFMISLTSKIPLIWDEAGYMGIASKIATGVGTGFGYYGGYSVLIAPAYWLSKNTLTIYRVIQIINALIISFVPVLVFLFTCKFNHSLSTFKKILISIAVSVYPGYLISSNLALPEGTFAVLFTLLMYLAYDTMNSEKYTFKNLTILSGLYIFLCFVHPRALPILFIFIGFYIFKKMQFNRKTITITGIIFVIFSIIFLSIISFFTNSDNINIRHFSKMILDTVSLGGLGSFLSSLITQFTYLILSTFGFVLLGFFALFRKGRNREGRVFLGLCFLSVMVISATFMHHIERADHVLYGRYNEGALIPLLVCGIVFALTAKIKKRFVQRAIIISILILTFTAVLRWEPLYTLTMNYVNAIPSFYITNLFLPAFHLLWVYFIFAVFILSFLLVFKKNYSVGMCVFILINLVFTLYMNFNYFPRGYQDRSSQTEVIQKLKEYREKDGTLYVNFEKSTQDAYWHMLNYSIYIPDIHIEEFTSLDDLPFPDSNLIVTSKSDTRPKVGTKVSSEKNISIDLWDTDKTTPALVPSKGLLSANAYRSDIKTDLEKDTKISVNDKFEFHADITHTGSDSLWGTFPYIRDMKSTVRLSMNVFDSNFNEVYANQYDLPKNVYPGETISLNPYIESWDLQYIQKTYGNGNYLLHLELVQNFTTWFSQKNDTGLFNAELEFNDETISINNTNYITTLPKSAYQFKNVRPYLLFGIDEKSSNQNSFVNNLINIKGDYTRSADATITNIKIPVTGERKIVLETKGNNPYEGNIDKAELQLYVNGLECTFSEFSKNSYYFILPENISDITEIKIHSNTYRLSQLPSFLGYKDSSPYLYTFVMKGIRKVTGLETNSNVYGIDINQIYLDQTSVMNVD